LSVHPKTIKVEHEASSVFAAELYSINNELVQPSTLVMHEPSSTLANGL